MFGNSISCDFLCAKRNCRIKSGFTCKVVQSSDAERSHRLLAFRVATSAYHAPDAFASRSAERTPSCCRFHDESIELHCSFSRLRREDTGFGFPIFFYEGLNQEVFALVVRLEESNDSDCGYNDVVTRCVIPVESMGRIEAVPMSRLRTSCLVVSYRSCFFVLRSGIRTYRHLQ